MPKQRRSLVIVVVVVLAIAAFFGFRALTKGNGPEQLSLDRYTRDLDAGKVATATIHDKDHTVTGKLTDGTDYTVNFPRSTPAGSRRTSSTPGSASSTPTTRARAHG